MSSAESAAAVIAPPSDKVISLTGLDLGISCIFLLLCGYITWQHGKAGMVGWPIFITTFIARIIADAYLLANKDDPMKPNAVTGMTKTAVIAGISLTIVGTIYQANTMLPSKNKNLYQKLLLGVTHLISAAGIGMYTFADPPYNAGKGRDKNHTLSQAGNLLLIAALCMVAGWMVPTWRKIQRYQGVHPNVTPVKWLFFATVVALPFWMIRLVGNTTYAFAHSRSDLDPVMGSFATKLLLIFGTYFFTSTALLVGGWYGVSRSTPGKPDDYSPIDAECAMAREISNDIEMTGQERRFK